MPLLPYSTLSQDCRLEVRGIARQEFLAAREAVEAGERQAYERRQDRTRRLARQRVADPVREAVRERYGSIVAAFLIQLAIKLAVELIVYWIKTNYLEDPPTGGFQAGEPGA